MKNQKYGILYHSRGTFRKVSVLLERGVVLVLVDWMLSGIFLEARDKGLGVVGWLVLTGDIPVEMKEEYFGWGVERRIPESGELPKRFGVERQLLFLGGKIKIVFFCDDPHVSGKIIKKSFRCCRSKIELIGWFNWESRFFANSL